MKWRVLREALLKDERHSFDSMVSHSLKYAGGADAYRERKTFDLLATSSLLSHEERLRALEEGLRMRMTAGLTKVGGAGAKEHVNEHDR